MLSDKCNAGLDCIKVQLWELLSNVNNRTFILGYL